MQLFRRIQLSVLFMEPVSNVKRRRYFEQLKGPEFWSQPTLSEVKEKLKEIREYSLDNLNTLVAKLTAGLSASPEMEVTLARDAGQAIETIKGIARGSRVAINRSTVIINDLMPMLVEAGYNVIESYFDEFEPFDNVFSDYWQLPATPFEARFQSFSKPRDLVTLRSDSLQRNGAKDFTGLLGINALVAGLDKIVKNRDDAVFQTKSMAAFGSQVLPLTAGGKAEKGIIDTLPFEIPGEQASSKIHPILLDNGRREILVGPYRELLNCIDCQACIKGCPTSKYFNGVTRWSPRSYIYFFLTGKNPSLGLCLQCKSCETNCPLDIDIPGMILDAKTKYSSGRRRSLTDILIANAGTLEGFGSSTAWLTNAVLANRPLRWAGEKVLDISRRRHLPRINRRPLAKWFRSRARKC
jgi:L-lactate utilization protein LutB